MTATAKPGGALVQLSNATTFPDGTVSFRVETDDESELNVRCSVADIGNIFAFLGALVRDAEVETEEAASQSELTAPAGYPAIAADGLGFLLGRTPETTGLAVRVGPLILAFECPSSALADLADGFARIARTLSAGTGKPQ